MIIKQEPIVNIKQEIFEFNKSTRYAEDFLPYNTIGQDYYADAESDAYCECCDVYFINNVELKNHIVDCHSDNPRERANNCEIMEIITLENAAFIDLDENCVEEATVPLGRTTFYDTLTKNLQSSLTWRKRQRKIYGIKASINKVEFGRTSPSISSIINQWIDIIALDIKFCLQISWPNLRHLWLEKLKLTIHFRISNSEQLAKAIEPELADMCFC